MQRCASCRRMGMTLVIFACTIDVGDFGDERDDCVSTRSQYAPSVQPVKKHSRSLIAVESCGLRVEIRRSFLNLCHDHEITAGRHAVTHAVVSMIFRHLKWHNKSSYRILRMQLC